LRGIQAVVVEHFFVGDAQLAEQQPNDRRRVRGSGRGQLQSWSVSVFKQWQEYNQLVERFRN
jgi:hypothetical protein